jgi:hypothetical protein
MLKRTPSWILGLSGALLACLLAALMTAQTPLPSANPAPGLGNLTTGGNPGPVPYVSASGVLGEDATNFCWDATNHRLGIGTCAPGVPLAVVGAITATSLAATGNIQVGSANFFIVGSNSAMASASNGVMKFVKNDGTTPSAIQSGEVAVSGLATCNSTNAGSHASVNDSNAASYTAGIGATVAAGGSTHVPVFCDGTNWRIG